MRGAGHFQIPIRLALRASADGGSCLARARGRRHLLHRPHVHLHSGTGSSSDHRSRRSRAQRTERRRRRKRDVRWSTFSLYATTTTTITTPSSVAVYATTATATPTTTATTTQSVGVLFRLHVSGPDDDVGSPGIASRHGIFHGQSQRQFRRCWRRRGGGGRGVRCR